MIGVVGGGIAGLAAAYELQSSGYDVHVFEAKEVLGGGVRPVDRGAPNRAVPHWPCTIGPTDDALRSLADTVGVSTTSQHVRRGYYVDGVAHPTNRLWELLAFPSLSLREKLSLRSLYSASRRGPFGFPATAFATPDDYDDVTARSLVSEHATDSLYEYAIEPMLRSRFGDSSGQVSAAWLLTALPRRGGGRSWRGETSVEVDGGLPAFVDALSTEIGSENVTTDARVRPIGTRSGAVDHLVTVTDGRRVEHDAEAVIIAAAPSTLDSLTTYEWDGQATNRTCVCFGLDEPLLDVSDLVIVDDAPFVRLVERPMPDGGGSVLYAISPTEWRQSEDTTARFRRGVESLFPEFDPDSVRWSAVSTAPVPIPRIGYREHVVPHDLGDHAATGCYYAGVASESQYPVPSLDGAVRAGRTAAQSVIARLAESE